MGNDPVCGVLVVLSIRGVDDTQGGDGTFGILGLRRQAGCNNGVDALLTAFDGVGLTRVQVSVEAALGRTYKDICDAVVVLIVGLDCKTIGAHDDGIPAAVDDMDCIPNL